MGPSFPRLWSSGKSLIPESFSQAQSLQGISRGVNPEHPWDHSRSSLCSQTFSLSSLRVSRTPLEKAPSPTPPWVPLLWGSIQGCFPAKSMGFAFPEHHIPVTFPADSWESPLLRFHPGTLKQKPGDASQKPQGISLPTFPRLGFFLGSRDVRPSQHLPQTGSWDSWDEPGALRAHQQQNHFGGRAHSRDAAGAVGDVADPGGSFSQFFWDGSSRARAWERSRRCALQVTSAARWGCSSGPASSPSSSSSITCTR